METVETLFKSSLDELDKLLSSKTVVGDPIKVGDETLIPLLSLGFGFGAGGGKGSDPKKGTGDGGGSGAGAGVKAIAVIITDGKGHTRVEPISGGLGDALSKVATSVGKLYQEKEKGSETKTDA